MVALPFRMAVAGLALFTPGAFAERPGAEEAITLTRIPMGLHPPDAPFYEVTLSSDAQVVFHRPYELNSKASDDADRYGVSPAEAARFRAALVRHRPAGQNPEIICGGHVYGADNQPLIRVPVFKIEWGGAGSRRAVVVCDTPQEQAIVDEIRQGLQALHLRLDGNRF